MTQEQYIDAYMDGVRAAFKIIKGEEPDDIFREIGLAHMARKIQDSANRLVSEEERE